MESIFRPDLIEHLVYTLILILFYAFGVYLTYLFWKKTKKSSYGNYDDMPDMPWKKHLTTDGINYDPIYIRNCNKCKHINFTEDEQHSICKSVDHICSKYNRRVFHRSQNPHIYHEHIYPCNECNGKSFEERKS